MTFLQLPRYGRLELKRDGATIASSDQAALFALSLKAGFTA